MQNSEQEVTLWIRVKAAGTWKYFQAAYGLNGKVIPGVADVPVRSENGKLTRNAKGKTVTVQTDFSETKNYQYYIRWYVNGKTKQERAGKHSIDAEAKRASKQKKLAAAKKATSAGLVVTDPEQRLTIRHAIKCFIDHHKANSSRKTIETYLSATSLFKSVCSKNFMDEVDKNDMATFLTACKFSRGRYTKGRPTTEWTIATKINAIHSLFKFHKMSRENLGKIPKVTRKKPKIYQADDLCMLFEKLSDEDVIIFGMALFLGLRSGEIAHGEFSDINFTAGVYSVRSKVEKYGWCVKAHHERDITIPDHFLEKLRDWRAAHPGQSLIFDPKRNQRKKGGKGIVQGTPVAPGTIWYRLKLIVHKNGLNCGRCQNCLNPRPHRFCSYWRPHRFRSSSITTKLRNNIDLATVSEQAGHLNFKPTQEYALAAGAPEVRTRVSNIDFFSDPYAVKQPPQPLAPVVPDLSNTKLILRLRTAGLSAEQILDILYDAGENSSAPGPKLGPVLVKNI